MSEIVRCARALTARGPREDFAFVVGDDGRIADAGDFAEVRARNEALPTRAFPADRVIVPGFVNGHSHAYQILLRGWGDDRTFQRWRSDALYSVVPRLEPDDVYWTFAAAFGEMLGAGITSVVEFFYLNGSGNAHAQAAIHAAEDTGIRLILARTWMDAPGAPAAFRESAADAAERTRSLRAANPGVAICVAPHSLHGASQEMLEGAAAFAKDAGCDLHIHVAETESEVDLARERFQTTPVVALDRLGILSECTVAVHAIHVTQEEKNLLGQRRVRVVRCPTTNLYLGDGLGEIDGFRERGISVGLGTDANVKPSILDEMRAASYEQKALRHDGSALGAAAAFGLGTYEGARAAGIEAGDLAAGMPADFCVLDGAAIDPWSPLVNWAVYRCEPGQVQATFVGGRRVYTGEPSPLRAQARARAAGICARLL
ncbi:MAG: amidohydrolase family protein [Candidatus Tyrphobacter sp.]